MRIAIASDHAALEMRKQLVKFLTELGHEVEDCGPDSTESVDYPDFAAEVGKRVATGQVSRVFCAADPVLEWRLPQTKCPAFARWWFTVTGKLK